MIRKVFLYILTIFVTVSCGNNNERPTSALDTGRSFIRATLNGDFEDAYDLLYKDPVNVGSFESYRSYYKRLKPEEKQNYKESDYSINKYLDIDDSTTIINYSNSYMKKPLEIKIIKKNGLWLIDFKYTFSGNLTID